MGSSPACLAALARRFDDARVTVDRKVFNPARIWKLYGTVARKGDHTAERPHRVARLLHVPEALRPVAVEMLLQCASERPSTPPGSAQDARRTPPGELPPGSAQDALRTPPGEALSERPERRATARSRRMRPGAQDAPLQKFDLRRWIEQHRLPVGEERPWGNDGARRWQLAECPWNPAHRGSAYIILQPDGSVMAGCLHNSCRNRRWRDLKALVEGEDAGAPDVGAGCCAPAGRDGSSELRGGRGSHLADHLGRETRRAKSSRCAGPWWPILRCGLWRRRVPRTARSGSRWPG